MRTRVIALVAILVLSMVAIGNVSANPEPVEQCSEAPNLEPGAYSTTIAPNEEQYFTVEGMSQGDYLTFDVDYDVSDHDVINIGSGVNIDSQNIYTEPSDMSAVSEDWDISAPYFGTELNAEPDGSGELWLETEKTPCIRIATEGQGGYAFSFDINSPTPPRLVTSEQVEDIESENSDLRNQVEQQNSRIEELQSENTDLQEQVDELQTQVQNADVTINVTVAPAGEIEDFRAGERARITATTQTGDLSELDISFADESYSLGENGQTTVPLESVGSKQMTFSYDGNSKSKSVEVLSAESEPPSEEESSSNTSDESGVGFTVGSALAGIGGASYVLKRRQQTGS